VHELRILPRPDLATPRQVRFVNVVLVAWTAAWLALAVLVARDVFGLDRWSDLLQSVARSIDQAAKTLGSSGSPLTGTATSAKLHNLAGQALSSAANARTSIQQLAYLLGVAIGLIPTVPAVALFLQFRVSRSRERSALAEALCDPAERMAAVRYLAERALQAQSLHELMALQPGSEPLGFDVAGGLRTYGASGRRAPDGVLRRLAEAEARRLGLAQEVARAAGTDPG
jgi:hypothetical protein